MIKDGITGYIIEPTTESLKDALSKCLIKNRSELIQMGIESYKLYLSKFTENVMFSEYAKLYNTI